MDTCVMRIEMDAVSAVDSPDHPSLAGSTPKSEEEEKIITYERRHRRGNRKRKLPDESSFDSQTCERIGKKNATYEMDGPIASSSDMTSSSATEVPQSVPTESSPLAAKNCSSLFGSHRTRAPKRIVGQYFLDLGQSDFSYSTCRTCGMLYAPGHENDEKVHQSFHRNHLQGIQFKGWRDERVASRIDLKGNRVIVIRAEEIYQRTKVQEVIQFMEVELGLSPGWLLQRSCTVYLFVSSAKKIVGCLMAEQVQSAYRVVPEAVKDSGKEGKVKPSEQDASSVAQTGDLSGPAVEDTCGASDESKPEFAERADSTDARERCKIDEQATTPCTSGREEKSAGRSNGRPISVSILAGRRKGRPTVRQKTPTSSLAAVKENTTKSTHELSKAKITDYFLLRIPRPGQIICKSEQNGNETECGSAEGSFTRRMDGASRPTSSVKQEAGDFEFTQVFIDEKPDIHIERPHVDEKMDLHSKPSHLDEKPDIRSEQRHVDEKPELASEQPPVDEKAVLNFQQTPKDEKPDLDSKQAYEDQKPNPCGTVCPKVEEIFGLRHEQQNQEFDFTTGHVDEKICSTLDEVSRESEEGSSQRSESASFFGVEKDQGKQVESQSSISIDKGSVHGGKDKGRIMMFGNVKFSRELAMSKRVKKEQLQDLGRAILRTTEPVPVICGVRAIWVSQLERRKGIATHLLDAMRKTFVLGISIGTSQFAFSQPTPEGRKFAEQYCKTNQFLVYTTR